MRICTASCRRRAEAEYVGVLTQDDREELQESMERVLGELRNYTAFLVRVSKRDAPDYYDGTCRHSPVIHHPMDLGTMQKKLKSAQYKTKAQFSHDLDLIWDNCLLYNASPQHPLRRSATFMRKKANHLLEFLSERKDIKEILSNWHPPPSEPPQEVEARTPSPTPHPAPSTGATEDVDVLSTPFAHQHALERQANHMLTFAQMDPRVAQLEDSSDAHATASTSTEPLAALTHFTSKQTDPLHAALPLSTPAYAWWDACASEEMVRAGLPVVPFAGHARSPRPPQPQPTSRLPTQRHGLPRMIARNIKTMHKLHRTHQKFFRLADVVEQEQPIPPDLADASSSEDESEAEVDEGHVPLATPTFPRLTPAYARDQLAWQVQTLLAHAGFDGSHKAAVQVLTDVTLEYISGLGRTLRLYMDRFSAHMDAESMVVHTLKTSGGIQPAQLTAYVQTDVERYGVRLREWLRKLHAAYREQLVHLGRAAVEVDALLAHDAQALILGHFAEGLGDDFFGFRELGLDRELGLSALSVPSRLFFGRGGTRPTVAVDGNTKTIPMYPPPPPLVMVTRASLPAQIGLLRPWYAAHLDQNELPLPTDCVPEKQPEKPRYKVPTSGRLPARPLVGEARPEPQENKAPKPPPPKRKRAVP